MLYVSTRERYDASTSIWTLKADHAADGGLYLPFKLPTFSAAEVAELKEQSFGQTVAQMLNLFFSADITGWDVEFAVGRHPLKIDSAGQKVMVAETWRNLDGSYEKMERHLAAIICKCSPLDVKVTSWLRIAIRIAVLFGIFGQLQRHDVTDPVDVAVNVGELDVAMAVWYGRKMGLPIANIICGCRDNDAIWELLHMGQMRTAGLEQPELERLVHGTLGVNEAIRFSGIVSRGETYSLLPADASKLRNGMFAAVVSRERIDAAIPNVLSTSGYTMGLDVAVGYSGLMDYRARTGARTTALLLSDRNPQDTKENLR